MNWPQNLICIHADGLTSFFVFLLMRIVYYSSPEIVFLIHETLSIGKTLQYKSDEVVVKTI